MLKKYLLMSLALISACSFATDNLEEEQEKETLKAKETKTLSSSDNAFVSRKSDYDIKTAYQGSSGTLVGQKITELRNELAEIIKRNSGRDAELEAIRKKTSEDADKYHELVAVINSRLQIGTTPGNPILNEKWHMSNVELEAISSDIASLNNMMAALAADSGMLNYILDSIRAAFSISGAVDEDHSQLKILENQAIQTSIQVERMFNDISLDVNRQQQFLATEKKNVSTLAMAIRDGQIYSQDPMQSVYGSYDNNDEMVFSTVANRDTIEKIGNRKPLVSIKFDKRNVAYEQALYQAVKRAVEKKRDVKFEVVGVSPLTNPISGTDVKRSTDLVYKSILKMGVPASRVKTATVTSAKNSVVEVKVFVK